MRSATNHAVADKIGTPSCCIAARSACERLPRRSVATSRSMAPKRATERKSQWKLAGRGSALSAAIARSAIAAT